MTRPTTAQVDAWLDELRCLREDAPLYQFAIDGIAAEVHALRTEVLSSDAGRDAAFDRVIELKESNGRLQGANDILDDTVGKLTTENAHLRAKLDGQIADNITVIAECQALRADVSRWKDECSVQQSNDALGQAQLAELREDNERWKAMYEAQVSRTIKAEAAASEAEARLDAVLAKVRP